MENNTMAKTANKLEQSAIEQSPVQAMGNAATAMVESATAKVETPVSLSAILNDSVARKRAAFATAKETLQEAIALEGNEQAASNAVSETQAKAINILARGVILKDFSKDEVSAILGDAYGYKPKSDGTPGKTPEGNGAVIRKRVVTLSEAFGIANGMIAESDFPKWAQGKSVEAIAPIVTQWEAGNLSPWQAYKDCMEKEKPVAVAIHANEKRLLEIAKALHDDTTLRNILDNPALVAVYTAICEGFTRELPPVEPVGEIAF